MAYLEGRRDGVGVVRWRIEGYGSEIEDCCFVRSELVQ